MQQECTQVAHENSKLRVDSRGMIHQYMSHDMWYPVYMLQSSFGTAYQKLFSGITDAKHGRWRSEVFPDLVVYPDEENPDKLWVLNEATGRGRYVDTRLVTSIRTDLNKYERVAQLYTERNLAPNPTNARHGKTWTCVIGTGDDREEFTFLSELTASGAYKFSEQR